MECFWARVSAGDFPKLRKASKGVAVLPLGCLETHGPHLPLGTDGLAVDEAMRRLAQRETVAILPTLYYNVVTGAPAGTGGVHIKQDVMFMLLENICDEAARNGFTKICLANGHGCYIGSIFPVRILEAGKDYTIYNIPAYAGKFKEMAQMDQSAHYGHACSVETSMVMASAEGLVHLEKMKKKSFPINRVPDIGVATVPVRWAMQYPELCVGEPHSASRKKGETYMNMWVDELVATLRKIKRDQTVPAAFQRVIRNHRALPQINRNPARRGTD